MKLTRIVAVEDESIIALNLKQQLRGLGYEVCAIAASGAEALKAIAEFSPDLVLMDIRINGELDGIETAQRIPAGLGIPVIYLSAYSEDATLDRARATRPYGYLIKPYSERELHATIQMALERRQVEVALRDSEERFRTIFAAVSEGIFIAEAQTGLFNEVNEPGAVMLGYGAAELVGRDIETISSGIAPYTMAEALQWIQKAVESGQPLRFPWVCKTRSGVHVPVEVGLRATTLGGRQVVLAVLRDMSEHLAMQAELLQAQKM